MHTNTVSYMYLYHSILFFLYNFQTRIKRFKLEARRYWLLSFSFLKSYALSEDENLTWCTDSYDGLQKRRHNYIGPYSICKVSR